MERVAFLLLLGLVVALLEGVLLKSLVLFTALLSFLELILSGVELLIGLTAGLVVLSLGFVLLKSLLLLLGVKVGLVPLSIVLLLLLLGLVTLLLSLAELILSKLLLGLLVLSGGTIAGLVVLALGFLTALGLLGVTVLVDLPLSLLELMVFVPTVFVAALGSVLVAVERSAGVSLLKVFPDKSEFFSALNASYLSLKVALGLMLLLPVGMPDELPVAPAATPLPP